LCEGFKIKNMKVKVKNIRHLQRSLQIDFYFTILNTMQDDMFHYLIFVVILFPFPRLSIGRGSIVAGICSPLRRPRRA
jgi:hypothetical protein